jgi:hypothetical protein
MRLSTFALVLGALCMAARSAAQAATPATIPLEVLAPEPALSEGQIVIGGRIAYFGGGPIVAAQPARVARGIVLEKSRGRGKVLGLAILGALETDASGAVRLDNPARTAWCELPSAMYMSSWTDYTVDCFQDSDADGALDRKYSGLIRGDESVMLESVDSPEPIKPLRYRLAEPAERPRFDVGYWSCGAAAETTAAMVKDFRYSTLVRAEGTKGLGARACRNSAELLETRADGTRVMRFDRFTVEVRQEGERLHTRLVEGIPAGTVLGNLRPNRPLLEIDEAPPSALDELEDNRKPVLYLTTIPETRSQVREGEQFFTAGVAHGITGRLRSDVSVAGWRRKVMFTAGTPVYGLPMETAGAGQLKDSFVVWCLPYRDPAHQVPALTALCFKPHAYGYGLAQHEQPFHVEALHGTFKNVESPVVDRGDVDFGGPLQLWMRFVKAGDEGLVIETSVSYPDEPRWKRMELKLTEQGMATLMVGGALLDLRPGADQQSLAVQVWGEFQAGADAMVKRVRRTSRN